MLENCQDPPDLFSELYLNRPAHWSRQKDPCRPFVFNAIDSLGYKRLVCIVRLSEELRPLTYSLVGRKTKLMPRGEWATILGHTSDVADALIQSMILTG